MGNCEDWHPNLRFSRRVSSLSYGPSKQTAETEEPLHTYSVCLRQLLHHDIVCSEYLATPNCSLGLRALCCQRRRLRESEEGSELIFIDISDAPWLLRQIDGRKHKMRFHHHKNKLCMAKRSVSFQT